MRISGTLDPMTETRKETAAKGISYLLIGGASALIELGLFNIVYYLFGNNAPISNIIAILIATCFNFLMNKSFTFKSSSNMARSAVLYPILFASNLVFTTITTSWLIDIGVFPLIAKIATMGCVVIWNFFLYNKLIFK